MSHSGYTYFHGATGLDSSAGASAERARSSSASPAGSSQHWGLSGVCVCRFSTTFANTMHHRDVLISPTLSEPAPALGYLAPDLPFDVAFERVRPYAEFTSIYNLSGSPAITLPLGRSTAGLPIGVQFGAAHGGDQTLLELALSIEAARPWEAMAPRHAWVHAGPRSAMGSSKSPVISSERDTSLELATFGLGSRRSTN